MNNLHVEDFYKDAAIALTRLYSVFPRKHTLWVEEISGPDNPDEYGLHSDRYMGCFSTLLWLADYGFIRYEDTIRQDAIDQAVLTQKAFVLLSKRSELPLQEEPDESLPQSIRVQQQTNIYQLKQALRSKSSSLISQCMLHLLEQG